MNLHIILVLLLIFHFPLSFSSKNKKYKACSEKLQCGNLGQNISYPFYDGSTRPDYCGYPGFKLDCMGTPQIIISDQAYIVRHINMSSYVIRLSIEDDGFESCPDKTTNDFSKFSFISSYQNITFFYDCGSTNNNLSVLLLSTTCTGHEAHELQYGYYLTQTMVEKYEYLNLSGICKSILSIPISEEYANKIDSNPTLPLLISAFREGVELSLISQNEACIGCIGSGGECGYDSGSNKFVCHCADDDYQLLCGVNPDQGHLIKKHIYITATSAGITVVVLASLVLFAYYIHQKYKLVPKNQSVEDCLRSYASLVSRRYTYTNVKKMTNSFKEKLGEGGYGTVFKGNLKDGRFVAVKVWKQSKGDGKEFLNEVMSISSTNHVNVVPLLGFCFEGHKRALVYEFMSNGSLEKFLQRKNNAPSLSSEKLLDIAIGIARGLEYLHRGCNTRIVHFDIKPHNILLDAEFTPKISDFGLAKSLKAKESIISMSGARGTVGYIAPEVFLRTFGGVSHKSDVYSFGMMVLEMAGCTKRGSYNVENSSEMYFPHWIYKKLERETTLDCGRMLNDKEKDFERKMVLVGLWCIQTNPLSRPPMSSVVGMLEGKVELHAPQMASLSSPRLLSAPPLNTHHFHAVQNI